ncbi:MAG: hypothetical protein ABI977_26785 [Acidobacteriota bacterium]
MIPVTNNEDAAAAKYAIERAMLGCSAWQVFAGEVSLTTIHDTNCELSVEWGKLIFAWWDDQRSQSWRVTAYEIEEAELLLQVTRGLGREMTTLTLRNEAKWREKVAFENLGLTERRRAYAQTLARLLAARFIRLRLQTPAPGATNSELAVGTTAKRYARLRCILGGETVLAIGVSEAESQTEIDGVIAAGLVWLANFNGQREARPSSEQAKRLWFCLPRGYSETGMAETAMERLTLLDVSHLGARVECFEVDERREELRPVQLATQNELLNAHPRELKWPEASTASDGWRERIVRLAPDLIEVRQIAGRESYAINGLEFARLNHGIETRLKFGIAGLHDERSEIEAAGFSTLSEANFHRLERLVQQIVTYRSAQTPDRRHPFYRLREEAWLESLLRRDIRALDAGFDDRFVYSQIPAWRGEERSVIDLLTVNHEARLAVIEIKATEDAQLPLQGTDYWLRVEQARLRGEFAKRGLFAGIELAGSPSLLYLVAPRLRFHRTFAIVSRCLSPQIEAYQVGLNANWRQGARVRSIERVNQL